MLSMLHLSSSILRGPIEYEHSMKRKKKVVNRSGEDDKDVLLYRLLN